MRFIIAPEYSVIDSKERKGDKWGMTSFIYVKFYIALYIEKIFSYLKNELLIFNNIK